MAARRNRKKRNHPWVKWSNERLLDTRLCDLNVSIEGTPLEARVERVREELHLRGLLFKPYFWLSDEWFTPEGMTGTAIPFYLAHPRLMRLERSRMDEVEGGTHEWCMRILRHEVGHALDHAYKLNRRRKRQQLFGNSTRRYPNVYRPNPHSRKHVQHLSYWYAQSHPDEDFAETFAVWLRPRALWRRHYRGWPALKKLEYMDELMADLAGERPAVTTRAHVDGLPTLKKTLREHYAGRIGGVPSEWPRFYDQDLKRLFIDARGRGRETAAAFVRRVRPEVVRMVSRWIGAYRYHIDMVLPEIVGRCRELRLYVMGPEGRVKRDFALLLTKHTMDCVYRRRRRVEM
jgi:hypothetical protein